MLGKEAKQEVFFSLEKGSRQVDPIFGNLFILEGADYIKL